MLLLAAGALIAIERDDRDVVALLKTALRAGQPPRTHGGIVGQVWRGGSGRQARLARLLPAIEIAPIDAELGRRAGQLLKASKTADVVDAALVVLASDGDDVLTSDVGDLQVLAVAAAVHLELIPV